LVDLVFHWAKVLLNLRCDVRRRDTQGRLRDLIDGRGSIRGRSFWSLALLAGSRRRFSTLLGSFGRFRRNFSLCLGDDLRPQDGAIALEPLRGGSTILKPLFPTLLFLELLLCLEFELAGRRYVAPIAAFNTTDLLANLTFTTAITLRAHSLQAHTEGQNFRI